MADSYTNFLRVTLPATGAYNNTWGTVLNADTFNLFDVAIAGWTIEDIGSSTTFSLPALTNGGASDSRYFSLLFTGTPAAQATITVPSSVTGKMYLINNRTGQALLFTYSGSTNTVTVPAGVLQLIWCDGANTWPISATSSDSPSLGGALAANWVRASRTAAEIAASTVVKNSVSVPTAWPWFPNADAPTITFDCNNGNAQSATIAGNRTIGAPVNAVDGAELWLLIVQDATGSRALSWSTAFWFENGTIPLLATTPGGADLFVCRYNSTLNKWLVGHFYNLNAGAGTTATITITQNCVDWNLLANVGALFSAATINIVVAQGAIIEASSSQLAAMNLGGLISGSTINLTNNGLILGHGGDGGRGGAWVGGVSFGFQLKNIDGKAGGIAITGPGSGVVFNLINNGYVWGGGGGGGVGGWSSSAGANNQAGTGGGGGGAGNGRGGISFSFGDANGSVTAGDGQDGSMVAVPTAGFGIAGGSAAIGTADCGASGSGGAWGTAGANGVAAATAHTVTDTPSNGGAAGQAIALNGGGITITPSAGSTTPHILGPVS